MQSFDPFGENTRARTRALSPFQSIVCRLLSAIAYAKANAVAKTVTFPRMLLAVC